MSSYAGSRPAYRPRSPAVSVWFSENRVVEGYSTGNLDWEDLNIRSFAAFAPMDCRAQPQAGYVEQVIVEFTPGF